MPILSRVLRTGRCEVSTVRMISSFSDTAYLIRHRGAMLRIDVLPIRDHAFFERAVLERGFGQRLLELARLGSQPLDLVRSGLARGIAGEPLLAGLQELLGPAIIEVWAMPSLRHSSAMLSSPRSPSRTMRIFSSAENCRLVARRMSLTVSSALCGACLSRCLIVSLHGATTSSILSLTQSAQSVR